jgi:hypothetical protein
MFKKLLPLLFLFSGFQVHATPISALHILSGNPAAADGIYSIDTDGVGGNAAFDIYADMTSFGGGWSLGLASFSGDHAATTDMTSNTGTVGFNTSHTRDLSALALNSDSQIRHQLFYDGSVVFDGWYTGSYHGVFEADETNWSVSVGDVSDVFGSMVGNDWSTLANDVDDIATNCAAYYDNQPWYYGACWNAMPGYGGSSPRGPYVRGVGGYIDSWRIFVREGAEYVSVDAETVPEPSIIALFGLGLVGIGFARRRRS